MNTAYRKNFILMIFGVFVKLSDSKIRSTPAHIDDKSYFFVINTLLIMRCRSYGLIFKLNIFKAQFLENLEHRFLSVHIELLVFVIVKYWSANNNACHILMSLFFACIFYIFYYKTNNFFKRHVFVLNLGLFVNHVIFQGVLGRPNHAAFFTVDI